MGLVSKLYGSSVYIILVNIHIFLIERGGVNMPCHMSIYKYGHQIIMIKVGKTQLMLAKC